MNFYQIQTYAGFWGGAAALISLQNTFVSFYYLYKTRQTKVSSFLKIIINFSNFVRFTAVVGTYMTPDIATMLQCTSLQYLIQIGNFFVRVSLAAYLLWRLRYMHNNRMDNVVCLILLLLRAGFGVVPLAFQHPKTVFLPKYGITICFPNQTTSQTYTILAIVIDIFVDFYVAIRLYQILRKANKDAAQISNLENKNKRTLFTAIMYWNFLRLFVSLIFQVSPLLIYMIDDEARTITLQCLVNIIMSYVITADFEIVRAFKGGEEIPTDDSKKSLKSVSPQIPRTSLPQNYSGQLPNDLLKYSPQDSSFNDKDKIGVPMKKLSFVEWVNVVSGKLLYKNNDVVNDEKELERTIEDDIEKDPSQNQGGDDVEKGPNRDSFHSGSTSTLNENPDIIIYILDLYNS